MFVLVPIGLRGLLQPVPVEWRRLAARVRRAVQLLRRVRAFDDPIFQASLRNTAIILVGSLLFQGPLALAHRAAAQPPVPWAGGVPPAGVRAVRAGRGHRRRHLLADASVRRAGQTALLQSVRIGTIRLARRPACGHLDDADRPDLEVHRVRPHPVPGRAVERSGGAHRGGRDRRRELVADPATHHAARCSARRSGSGYSCR